MNESIPLSQKLYVLGIHPEKGGIISASYSAMNYVLVGSILIELNQNKNIGFDSKKVKVLNTKTDIEIYRFMLQKMEASKRSLSISRWIQKFQTSVKPIQKAVQTDLLKERIIRMQPKQFLFFKWEKPMLVKKQVVAQLISSIEKQIYSGSVTEDEMILLSFLKPAGLLRRIFPERDKRKRASKKLKQMMAENQVSMAVADAISAAQAVAASVAVSAAATS